jgi:hypothetical protein
LFDQDKNAQRSIGGIVGGFLHKLHAFSIDGLPVVSVEGEIAQHHETYRWDCPPSMSSPQMSEE